MPGNHVEGALVDGDDLHIGESAASEHVPFNEVGIGVVADTGIIEEFPPFTGGIRRMQRPGNAAR